MESYKNNVDKSKNKLSKDNEFISLTNKAIHFARLGNFLESEKILKELISKAKYDYLTLHRLAGISLRLGKDAQYLYYLKETIKLKKDYGEAYAELGNYFKRVGQIKNSLNYFYMAVNYTPNLYGVYINIGNIFSDLGRNEEALKNYKKALKIKNDFPPTLYNIGNILFNEKDFIGAEKYFLKALSFERNHTKSKIGLVSIYLETFNVKSLRNFRNFIKNVGITNDAEICRLMTFFYLDSSPQKQFLRAQNFYKKVFGNIQKINKIPLKTNKKKIRVGYISSNFNDHPVLKVMDSIFKGHDKTNFEIYAYYLFKHDDDDTKKVKKHFNSFKNISALTVNEMIKIIRSDELDIAVDLMGYTNRNRADIFNARIAPIQINYLGFAGTTCIPNMDFLIADKFVIPKKYIKFYSEKIIYMPNCFINSIKYQYSNSKESIKFNLPPKSFVLAAFHMSFKLSEEVVNSWISILKHTENSYLWLKVSNKLAKENLISHFKSNNVDIKKILFAEKVDHYSQHISRYSKADLFLDTFNFNGHSTLVECIWSELPFITLVGESFASRVGGSILNSLGLPELIAKSNDEYIEKVIFYSKNLDKLAILKNQIKKQKKEGEFFNQKLFVNLLEEKYKTCVNSFKST
jgi:predicted O-linked N-acetylglucosamine transferase (SPINDLY family)